MPIRTLPIVTASAALALSGAPVAHAQTLAPTPTGGAALGEVGPTGLEVAPGTLLGRTVEVSGTVASAANGPVRVERLDPTTRSWSAVARGSADDRGDFTVEWEPEALGPVVLRAVPAGSSSHAQAASSAPTATTTVYRSTRATWYGPGFWGRHTACGVRLTRSTLGVAHRHLPCGTRVALYHAGRQIEVEVIDRGPFTRGVSLDLTRATALRIGMTQTSRIGWVRTDAPAAAG